MDLKLSAVLSRVLAGRAAPWAAQSWAQMSASERLNFPPEGVDAGIPLVRDLLEGLMGLLLHDLEPGARDQLRNGAAELRATGHVAAAANTSVGAATCGSRSVVS
jgi:hypothetical protein